MLKCITCFWKGDWKLSLFPWLILALLLIYFFPVILLSQPAGFDLGEGILRGMCGRKLELKVVIGKMEREDNSLLKWEVGKGLLLSHFPFLREKEACPEFGERER